MTGIAEKLGAIGYATHAVGKWDAGMATMHHTPAGRGFQSWLGYFGHCNDYWTEIDK
jgi:arylsulfatase B